MLVVYTLKAYFLSRDDASASLFTQAGVELRRYDAVKRFHLPVGHSWT
jgi:hypothetical protein